jgi:hypothetical protein
VSVNAADIERIAIIGGPPSVSAGVMTAIGNLLR